MNTIDYLILLVMVTLSFGLGFFIGGEETTVLTLQDFCQSQSLEYQEIDDEYYCYGDNRLYPIEWMNES